jgi:hypothetical protein
VLGCNKLQYLSPFTKPIYELYCLVQHCSDADDPEDPADSESSNDTGGPDDSEISEDPKSLVSCLPESKSSDALRIQLTCGFC